MPALAHTHIHLTQIRALNLTANGECRGVVTQALDFALWLKQWRFLITALATFVQRSARWNAWGLRSR